MIHRYHARGTISNLMSLLECFSKCGPWTGSVSITGNLLEMQILCPTPDLQNQKLWRWAQQSVILATVEETLALEHDILNLTQKHLGI